MRLLSILVLSLGVPVLATACGEADQVVDCSNICEAYEDCIPGGEFDDCFDRCEDLSDSDADQCDACLDDASCAECVGDCAGLGLPD